MILTIRVKLLRLNKVALDGIVDYCPTERMVELEYEFCLPKGFWTSNEWRIYIRNRNRLINEIREENEERLEWLRNL